MVSSRRLAAALDIVAHFGQPGPVRGDASIVRVTTVEPSPTAVVRAVTTWSEFPSLWRQMLDEVWRFLGDPPPGVRKSGHNVMLYEDDLPTVEVGVEVEGSFERCGSVIPSALPGGLVATARHAGPIDRLGDTYVAIHEWCAATGHRMTRVRWEVYGDPSPDTGQVDVDVFWALATESVAP
jgi:effector-binding domain-containing protein